MAAPAAHAEDLPTGTFRMVNSNGGCARLATDRIIGLDLIRWNCEALNLREQFVFDPLTKQIRSVRFPDTCLEGTQDPDFGWFLNPAPCRNDVAGQKWERIRRELVYNIEPYNSPDRVMSTAAVDFGSGISLDIPVDPNAPAYTWTFTLL